MTETKSKVYILPSQPTGPYGKQGLVGQVVVLKDKEVIYSNLETSALASALLIISSISNVGRTRTMIDRKREPDPPKKTVKHDNNPIDNEDFRDWNG